jgi:hypothetical protein
MGKQLFFTLILASTLAAAPALAQEESYSEMPGTAAAANNQIDIPELGKAQNAAMSSSPVFVRNSAPINLMPGAYIGTNRPYGGAAPPSGAGTPSAYSPALSPSSVASYNRSVARKMRQNGPTSSGSPMIPSPFPVGQGFD